MRRIAILGALGLVATLGGGCALDAAESGRSEEPSEEATAAFTKSWKTEKIHQTDPIIAPIGSVIRVTSKADFADRARCGSKRYTASLIRFDKSHNGTIHQVAGGIARDFPLNQEHTEAWIGVNGGTYRVQFDTTRPNHQCELRGVLTVDITPPKP